MRAIELRQASAALVESVMFTKTIVGVAKWLTHQTSNPRIAGGLGSNPDRGKLLFP
jgi:hypothetical protein